MSTYEPHSFTAVVAAAIAAEAVTDTFGLMGAGTIRLTHHLTRDHGLAYHAARHEAGAVGAADGYARATGRPGVALTTWGPAVTNTVTAMTTAQRAGSPVVLVAADSSGVPADRNLFAAGTQRFEQQALFELLGVPVVRAHPRTAGRDVARAFSTARETSAPVALLLPMEYETSPASAGLSPTRDDAAPPPPAVDPDAVAAAAAALLASERPLILAGRGAVRAAARAVLEELADATGALLGTTLRAKDLFADHPFNLGVVGGYSGPLVTDLTGQADCVVSFGAALNPFTTKRRRMFGDAVLIHCDTDPEAIVRHGTPTIALLGDAREAATQLVAAVGWPTNRGSFRAAALAAGLDRHSWRWELDDRSSEGALDPRAICSRLDELLPADRTIVVDAGGIGEYPPAFMSVPEPDALMWLAGDFGAVGTGLAPAIGAALGRPERTTLLLIGDGGFFLAMQELDLAVRDRVPLLVVCLNDRAYGSEYHHMQEDGLPDVVGARFETPDLAGIARAMGCAGAQITSLDELDDLPSRLDGLDRPLVLDCLITREVLPSALRGHMKPPAARVTR
jgi:acetolactate synthase I/II/III large subunit